jgi:hypothetical protein
LKREPQEKLARKFANCEPGRASQRALPGDKPTGVPRLPACGLTASKIEAVAMRRPTKLSMLKKVPSSENNYAGICALNQPTKMKREIQRSHAFS